MPHPQPGPPMQPVPQPGAVGPPQRFIVGAITTRLTVTVPNSIVGGDLVRVAAPDGSYHSVVVPAGLSAGQQFSVELLAGQHGPEGSAAEVAKLRVELEAERHLRRDLQQEANRFRSVRRSHLDPGGSHRHHPGPCSLLS